MSVAKTVPVKTVRNRPKMRYGQFARRGSGACAEVGMSLATRLAAILSAVLVLAATSLARAAEEVDLLLILFITATT
jgi:hypothetical protein